MELILSTHISYRFFTEYKLHMRQDMDDEIYTDVSLKTIKRQLLIDRKQRQNLLPLQSHQANANV